MFTSKKDNFWEVETASDDWSILHWNLVRITPKEDFMTRNNLFNLICIQITSIDMQDLFSLVMMFFKIFGEAVIFLNLTMLFSHIIYITYKFLANILNTRAKKFDCCLLSMRSPGVVFEKA